jgi:hypothetical protein
MFGGEAFREDLIKRLDALKKSSDSKRRRRSGYTGVQSKDHGEAAAFRLVALGLRLAGLQKKDLDSLRKNDWRKRVIGRAIRRNTTVGVDLRPTPDGQRCPWCGLDGPGSRRFVGFRLEAGPIHADGD